MGGTQHFPACYYYMAGHCDTARLLAIREDIGERVRHVLENVCV